MLHVLYGIIIMVIIITVNISLINKKRGLLYLNDIRNYHSEKA